MEAEENTSGGWSIELYLAGGDERVVHAALQRRVWEELSWEALLQGAELRVEVAERVAVLEGTVEHYPAKAAAGQAARRVEGITDVDNRLVVRAPAARARSDTDLAGAAARALEWSALVPHERLTVEVDGGAVTLAGEVGRDCERAAAEDVVSRLAGVTDVRNRIAVRPAVHPEHLKDRVQDALRHEHAKHIAVDTRGDTVVLRGRVRSLAQRDEIEHAVRAVPGVAAVEDGIIVGR